MACVFKLQSLTVTWYGNTKTFQIQGSESEESCQYLSKLLKEHKKKTRIHSNKEHERYGKLIHNTKSD